ncbi:MAG: DNA ligase D [Bryobacteraceae bacterium]|nr:DNA ligase D [Bryobacteraceae bacterium]
MPLEEYVRKRNFKKTPEPPPESKPPAEGNRFFVQRHDASRLHYDFRLEIDGVLKSWAVPKGPTLVPLAKQLAVHVEDHPLSYGDFEGNIPKGEYGGGSVMLWDRGTYELLGGVPAGQQLARGDLKFRLHGEKLRGDFAIVLMKGRGKGNEWLLIKKRDEYADPAWDVEAHARSIKTGRTQEEIAADLPPPARAAPKAAAPKTRKILGGIDRPMPAFFPPMTAEVAADPPPGNEWLFEVKWDGVRALAFIENGALTLYSRRGGAIERQYPELSVLPHYVRARTAILDGEVAVLDEEGRSSFQLIQPRISVTDANAIAHLARSAPAGFYAFDLLYLDGYDLRQLPLAERKRLLQEIIQPHDRLHYSPAFEAKGEEMLAAARELGLEGVMAKRADSRYESRRSRCWLKVKAFERQEFVIGGFQRGEREYFSSLLLGVHREGALHYAGSVGTGFDRKTIKTLYERLEPLIVKKNPFAEKPDVLRETVFVRPEVVAEIKFLEWTHEKRLRAPVFLGLRADVDPEEVVPEEPPPPDAAVPLLLPEPLAGRQAKEVHIEVGGRRLKLTNVDKVFYPDEGYTKRDLLNYYHGVAPLLLPHLKDRPLSLKRYPNGIHEPFFFQKNTPETYPDWLRTVPIPSDHHGGESINFVVSDDLPSLLYLVNLGCVDQNPWMSRVAALEHPDFALIDLDPTEGAPFDLIVEAALLVRGKLDDIGMKGYPKTTGGDGLHIYIPLEPRYSYEQVRSFAELLFHVVFDEKPHIFTTPRSVAKRQKARVYFDYLQISTGKTISAPYVARAYPGAPVATPLTWDEVRKGLSPQQFTLGNALDRFRRTGDLFRPVLDSPQPLEPALERLARLIRR